MRGKTKKLEKINNDLRERLIKSLEAHIRISNIALEYIQTNSDDFGCSICGVMEPDKCEDWCPVGAMGEIYFICSETLWENTDG